MIAFALTLTLFLFWLVVGSAVVMTLRTRRNLLQTLLLAPTVGVATTVLPIFWLSRVGVPVGPISSPLAVLLLVGSLGVLWWRRPVRSVRRLRPVLLGYLPFLAVLVLALLMTGRPMLEFGLNWVGYANEDMVNYALGAHRFADGGFFEIPRPEVILNGTDYTQYYWLYVVAGVRQGSELLLAWTIGLTGFMGHQVFMPVLLALHLTLVSAAGALVLQSRRMRLTALVTCLLVSVSALTSLGALYQLIAQVGGIGMLAGATLLLLTPVRTMRPLEAARHGLLVGILGSGLFVLYSEVVPFLGLAFLLYLGVSLVRRQPVLAPRPAVVVFGGAVVAALVMVNTQLVSGLGFILFQAGLSGAQRFITLTIERELFPYFLVPSGLANLWGLQPIALLAGDPWLSVSVALGAILLVVALWTAAVQGWRRQPAALMTLAMFLLSVHLIRQGSGFGLFKLAMFLQPFLLGTLAVGWLGAGHRRPLPTLALRLAPLLLLAGLGLPTQTTYVQRSRDHGLVLDASSTRMSEELIEIVQPARQDRPGLLVTDTSTRTIAKLQSIYTRGISTAFPSNFFFFSFSKANKSPILSQDEDAELSRIGVLIDRAQLEEQFPWFVGSGAMPEYVTRKLGDDAQGFAINTLGGEPVDRMDCGYFIGTSERQSILNRSRIVSDTLRTGPNFFIDDCADIRNHLIFVDSALGHDFYTYTADSEFIGLNQLERDVMFPDKSFAGVGRWLLLQVLHPSAESRFVLEFSSTLKGDGESLLPPVVLIGEGRQQLGFIGRGSGRIFSAPIRPVTIAGRAFLGVDMGVDARRFPDRRTGLMRLFGEDVPLDRRFLTGFARDVSLLSAEELARLVSPASVAAFPTDLMNPSLEYSGIYEDGWISEASFFRLVPPSASAAVVVQGMVPGIDDPSFTTELRVLVDGQEIGRQVLKPGEFELRAPVPPGEGQRRVELHFSGLQRLPAPDGRQTAALMRFIGFEGSAQAMTRP